MSHVMQFTVDKQTAHETFIRSLYLPDILARFLFPPSDNTGGPSDEWKFRGRAGQCSEAELEIESGTMAGTLGSVSVRAWHNYRYLTEYYWLLTTSTQYSVLTNNSDNDTNIISSREMTGRNKTYGAGGVLCSPSNWHIARLSGHFYHSGAEIS